jgi:spore maturation protein CgeB
LNDLDLDQVLNDADLVLVHEWNAAELVQAIGRHRVQRGKYALFFHDTHHRALSDVAGIESLDLSGYDAILAFGESLRERYVEAGWARRAFTWHEAADVRVFRPLPDGDRHGLVFIGNYGDNERTRELSEFLFEPARQLGLSLRVFGVRYPPEARALLATDGHAYGGFLPNYRVPQVFAQHQATVHVPRGPYVRDLPGIPTIRVFEALACGIPLVSAPWQDVEGLFREGDFLRARNGEEMRSLLKRVLADRELASALSSSGRQTILRRHTCAHRVDELLSIAAQLRAPEVQGEVA